MISLQRFSRACPWLSALVVLAASFLVVQQDRNYNQTRDESTHLAAGMEWLTLGTYSYDLLHPPLARVIMALPLRLSGERSEGHHSEAAEGTALLNEHGAYCHNLLITRLTLLPFLWLADILLFVWMRQRFGPVRALVAVVLFSFCPVVLAYSAQAMNDMPLTATYLLSLLAFVHMLRVRTLQSGCWAGLAFGVAFLCKYTELPFFVFAIAILLLFRFFSGERLRGLIVPVLLGCVVALFVLWAGFRFSYGYLFPADTFNTQLHKTLTTLTPARQAFLLSIKTPAPPFVRGVIYAFRIGSGKIADGFLLGHLYTGGKWYFFPVVILAKTPIGLLILAAVGLWHALRRHLLSMETAVCVSAIAGPLLVGVLSGVNLGLRHILPIFPFVAMLGALGAGALAGIKWRLPPVTASLPATGGALLALALIGWEVVATVVATPQFLPYFNEAAMPFFGNVVVGSDLDMGQDLYRLEDRMRGIDPSQISLAYFGDIAIIQHASAMWRKPSVDREPNEWVCVSESEYRFHPKKYGWLAGLPFERVGRSIRLYHLPNPLPASALAPLPAQNAEEDR